MYTEQEIEQIRWLIENTKFLTDEGKTLYLEFLDQGEPFADEFVEAVQALHVSEDISTSGQIKEQQEKIEKLQGELVQAKKMSDEKTMEISEKYPVFLVEETAKAKEKLANINDEYDKKIEKMIKEDVEEDQIQAIKDKLNKKD